MEFVPSTRSKRDARTFACAATNWIQPVADMAKNTANMLKYNPLFKRRSALIKFGSHLIKSGSKMAQVALECHKIPFERLTKVMTERFDEEDKTLKEITQMLASVPNMSSRTFDLAEEIRFDMNTYFGKVLDTLEDNEIKKRVVQIRFLSDYFEIEKYKAFSLSEDDYVPYLEEEDGLLFQFAQYRSAKKGSLHSVLYDIIYRGLADPKNFSDSTALQAMHALVDGLGTYISIFKFLLDAHSFIGNYYFKQGNYDKYNEHFEKLKIVYREFQSSILDQTNNQGILTEVINVVKNIKSKASFNNIDSKVHKKFEDLQKVLNKIEMGIAHMNLPVLMNIPTMPTVQFIEPNIDTPLGRWKNGISVVYAVQYKFKETYSKVSKWTDPIEITTKAAPYIKITENLDNKEAIVYMKINNNLPQVVAILNSTRTEFRDIDRDLYDAAGNTNIEAGISEVRKYINYHANMNVKFELGRTALHNAAKACNIQLINTYLDKANYDKDWKGYTAFHVAAESGCESSFYKHSSFIFNNVNEVTNEGYTALHIATQKGHSESVIGITSMANMKVNVPDSYGYSPIFYSSGTDTTIINTIISCPQFEPIFTDSLGRTILHFAVFNDDYKMIKTLSNAQYISRIVNIVDNNFMTALYYACIVGNINVVDELLKLGGHNLSMSLMQRQFTPLHYAIFHNHAEVAIKLLKETDLNVNALDSNGATPLHFAAATGMDEVVKELINKNADVNKITLEEGYTPLHLAALRNSQSIVALLLENKAELNAKDKDGKTPLDLAIQFESKTVIDYLKSKSKQRYRKDLNSITKHFRMPYNNLNQTPALKLSNNNYGVVDKKLPSTSLKILKDEKPFKNSNGLSIQNIDGNSTILLLDLVVKKLLKGKHVSTENEPMGEMETTANAFDMIEKFEEGLETLQKEYVGDEIDLYEMFSKVKRALITGRGENIPNILRFYANKLSFLELEDREKLIEHVKFYN